ncbi:hypothetical protein TB2_019458 [Malus domestica]
MSKTPILLGTSTFSLEHLLNPASKLQVGKWFELTPTSAVPGSKPVTIRIALTSTTPIPLPYALPMVQTDPEIVHDREPMVAETRTKHLPGKDVIGITPSGATHVLAEFVGTGWSLMNNDWFFQLRDKFDEEDPSFELIGNRRVLSLPGKKLEYETKNCSKQKNEQNFMTAIEFSAEHPYGKAIKEGWLLLPGITLAFILADKLTKEGYGGFGTNVERQKESMENDLKEDLVQFNEKGK